MWRRFCGMSLPLHHILSDESMPTPEKSATPLLIIFILAVAGSALFFYAQFYDAYQKSIYASVQKGLVFTRLVDVQYYRAAAGEEKPVQLLFVGDIMLSRGVGHRILIEHDPTFPFLRVASSVSAADIAFGNLEGPISSRGQDAGNTYSFRADPSVVKGLVLAGFDVLSLANNHTLDWGPQALTDTIDILKKNNIAPIGAGKNESEANAPAIITARGVKVAYAAYTTLVSKGAEATISRPGLSHFDIEKMKEEMQYLRRAADIVIVSLHWGNEYEKSASEDQKTLGRLLVDNGADIVVGAHPHVPQEIERYKKGWIAYSLGNFVFDQDSDYMKGLGLRVTVRRRTVDTVDPFGVDISRPQYQPIIIENR